MHRSIFKAIILVLQNEATVTELFRAFDACVREREKESRRGRGMRYTDATTTNFSLINPLLRFYWLDNVQLETRAVTPTQPTRYTIK